VPLQIGAPDGIPQAQHDELLGLFLGGVTMLAASSCPAAQRNRDGRHAPLSVIAPIGRTGWLIGMIF
jgi:hypothetical protein